MENDSPDSVLDKLYEISGSTRTPSSEQYFLVASSLRHSHEDIRERAVFIGGLRWMDDTILNNFVGVLTLHQENSDEIRRLMIECLVAAALAGGKDPKRLDDFLTRILRECSPETTAAKAAFVGIKRLRGEMSKGQFAALDYDDIDINS